MFSGVNTRRSGSPLEPAAGRREHLVTAVTGGMTNLMLQWSLQVAANGARQ